MERTIDRGQEEELLAANETFYRAFRERNMEAMASIWARECSIACMHPGMDPLFGREDVLKSWREFFSHDDAPRIHCVGATAHMMKEDSYVTCLEGAAGSPPSLVATNVFTKENGIWRLANHHAGPLASRSKRETIAEAAEPHTLN